MEPDIIGEYFALRWWEENDDVKRLISNAWARPYEFARFLDRTQQDFSERIEIFRKHLYDIELPKGLTHIERGMIGDCEFFNKIPTSITIPDTVSYIDALAFHKCTNLRTIVIPGSVTSIGNYAFKDCTSLTSINISGDLRAIGNCAFEGCTNLTEFNILSDEVTIGEMAFEHCKNLKTFTLRGNASIGKEAFRGCINLTSVIVSGSVTSIDNIAFFGCSRLTSFAIPDSVTFLGKGVFGFCSSLTTIQVGSNNPNYKSIDGVLFDKAGSVLIAFPGGKGGKYTIPDSVTSIGHGAFYKCPNLSFVSIPASVTTIGNIAFYNCSNLKAFQVDSNNQNYKSIDRHLLSR